MAEEPKQPSESLNQKDISQREMVILLQKTIGQLEVIVNKLSTESMENLPPRVVVETLSSNTEVLTQLLEKTSPEALSEPTQAEKAIPANFPDSEDLPPEFLFDEEDIDLGEPTEPVKVQVESGLPKSKVKQSWWGGLLVTLQSFVPSGLSKGVITGILVTVAIAAIVVAVVLVSRPSPEVAQTLTPTETPTPTPQVAKGIETPLEIEAPGNPEPVEFAPPPGPELTPEQSLIASIQEEVTQLTRQYPEGLIATIEANFLSSRLMVTMGNEWYSLSPSRQNNLANGIFERSRRLDFRKLELIDKEGNVIARSPVVGQGMVILQREKELN